MQDELIIKYIKKRKQKGLEILIRDYNRLITSVVRTHLGKLVNYEEECVSDVFLAIWNNIDSFDKDKNTFKNWICAVAKHKSIDYKKKYLSKLESEQVDNSIYYIDKNLLRLELEEDINEILKHLNEKDKNIFIKYYLKEISPEDIAIENNISTSSLYSRLSRGRKKIRENLYKYGG